VKDNLFSIQSRNGNELKRNFPELQELTKLAKNVVDSEIVVMKQDKVDFHGLQERVALFPAKILSVYRFSLQQLTSCSIF